MRTARILLLAVLACAPFPLAAFQNQGAAGQFEVYSEHPRLLLKPQRLRLLRRERERQSVRWEQFDRLIAGGARMPEPGFAFALHYQVSGNEASGRKAIEWALGPGGSADLRQTAFVFDWCQPLLSEAQSRQLLEKLTAARAGSDDIPAVRTRALAAIAAFGHGAAAPAAALDGAIRESWQKKIAPALLDGRQSLAHTDVYPLFEMLHCVRDNLQLDLRDDARDFFRDLPAERLLSYYPATYPSPENDFRIPYYDGKDAPDLRVAAMSRIAEFSMVAYDNNAVESQFLQGWLLHDRFLLRGGAGIVYEFLWANPYQPGLSFDHMPLQFHNPRTGRLLLRSSWGEDASWAGYIGGRLQVFRDGKIQTAAVSPGKPLFIGGAGIASGPAPITLDVRSGQPSQWFLVGLSPSRLYDIEVEDEELSEGRSGRSGVLELPRLREGNVSVRVRESRAFARPHAGGIQ